MKMCDGDIWKTIVCDQNRVEKVCHQLEGFLNGVGGNVEMVGHETEVVGGGEGEVGQSPRGG